MKKEVVKRAIEYSKNFIILTDRHCDQAFISNHDTAIKDLNFNCRLNNACKKSEHPLNLESVVRDFNDDYIEIAVKVFDDKGHSSSATYIISYENIKEIIIYD